MSWKFVDLDSSYSGAYLVSIEPTHSDELEARTSGRNNSPGRAPPVSIEPTHSDELEGQ